MNLRKTRKTYSSAWRTVFYYNMWPR